MASLEELRRRVGVTLSDEELLLRATMPAGLVDAMTAAGPARRNYNPASSPILDLIRKLSARRDLDYVAINKAGMKLELRRQTVSGTANDRAGVP